MIQSQRPAAVKTIRDQLVAGLIALGYTQIANPLTRKFLVFRRPDSNRNWYVGKAGALRIGHTVGDSYSARCCDPRLCPNGADPQAGGVR
jgi:hypothetical protein